MEPFRAESSSVLIVHFSIVSVSVTCLISTVCLLVKFITTDTGTFTRIPVYLFSPVSLYSTVTTWDSTGQEAVDETEKFRHALG